MIMKSIKNIALSAMLTFGAFAAVTYTACTKDDCKDVVCQNGGTCSGGSCTCPSGYEGANCEIASSLKFVGTYSVEENCTLSGAVGPYTATITQSSSNAVNILLQNFGDFTATISVSGSVNGTTLTIPQQTVSGYSISGNGTYTGTVTSGTLAISYNVSGATNAESCSATWTKQ
jgi:hypothetical protein